jgi:hypothetical protein
VLISNDYNIAGRYIVVKCISAKQIDNIELIKHVSDMWIQSVDLPNVAKRVLHVGSTQGE